MFNMVCVDFYLCYDILKNDLLIKVINCFFEVVFGLKDFVFLCKVFLVLKGLVFC